MDTMSAKNFLQNTEVKFKVKMIATIIPAAIFLITILIEGTSEDCFNCVQMGMAAHTVYTV